MNTLLTVCPALFNRADTKRQPSDVRVLDTSTRAILIFTQPICPADLRQGGANAQWAISKPYLLHPGTGRQRPWDPDRGAAILMAS